MRFCRVRQTRYSCPKQNLEPRLSDASPTTHRTQAQGEQLQAGLPGRTGVTLGNKEAVCLFSSLPGDRTCQPPRRKMENQGAHPPSPRTELCGRAQAWRRPRRTTSCGPGEQPGVHPPQRPQAGDGRLGGYEEEAPEKGLEVCGQLNERCEQILSRQMQTRERVETGGGSTPEARGSSLRHRHLIRVIDDFLLESSRSC